MRAGFLATIGLVSLIGAGAPALADAREPTLTDPDAPAAVERFYDAASWRKLVDGKTLTYQVSWGVMGREWYEPGSNRVVYVYFDGRCYDGTWSEAGGVFCFQYDGEFCFQHFARGDALIARELDGDEQIVTEITDQRLSCKPDLTSWRKRSDPLTKGCP